MTTTHSEVKVGQRYKGWGRTWVVTKVWPVGAVDAHDVDDPARTIRWPLSQFKQRTIQR